METNYISQQVNELRQHLCQFYYLPNYHHATVQKQLQLFVGHCTQFCRYLHDVPLPERNRLGLDLESFMEQKHLLVVELNAINRSSFKQSELEPVVQRFLQLLPGKSRAEEALQSLA